MCCTLGVIGQEIAKPPPEPLEPAKTPTSSRTLETLQAVDLGGLETRTAAMMLSGQEAGDLDVSMIAIPLPGGDGTAANESSRVMVAVDIGGDALLAAADVNPEAADNHSRSSPKSGDNPQLITEVYAYAIDAQNGLVASLTQAFRLDLTRHRKVLRGGSVQFFGSVDLPPGQFSLRLLVLHRQSGRIGLRTQPVVVPSWRADRVLLPPLRREPAGPGVLVRQAGDAELPFPLLIDGQPWVPSAPRSVLVDTPAAYLLLGRGLEGNLHAELLGGNGEALPGAEMQRPRNLPRGLPGVESLAAELVANRIDAGDYRLRVSSTDGGIASVAPFSVRLPDNTLSSGDNQPTSGRSAARPVPRLKADESLRNAFLTAFDFLESRDRAALLPLIALEQSRIGGGSIKQQKRLADAELRIAAELGRSDVEALVPMMWLHEVLYRHYRQTKNLLLATHSREVLIRLTQLYTENQKSPKAGGLVADVLVSLAGFLQNAGSLMSAEHTYSAALDHQPDHTGALIGLATIRESYGAYQDAADALEQLIEAGTSDPEIALRLALNQMRLGSKQRATERLKTLAELPDPAWIAALAAQELATLQAAGKQPSEAVTTLEAAIERFPTVQRLPLQLASLLDRLGRSSEAREVLRKLDPQTGSDQISPRLRYSRMPKAPYLMARQSLADAANERLALVVEPLSPEPSTSAADSAAPSVAVGGER